MILYIDFWEIGDIISVMNRESLIPPGCYCYHFLGKSNKDGSIPILKCPWHDFKEGAPTQENGFCHFLEEGDQDNTYHMLWDLVKSCGVNDDIDEREDKSMRKTIKAIIQWMKKMIKEDRVPEDSVELVLKEIDRLKEVKNGSTKST